MVCKSVNAMLTKEILNLIFNNFISKNLKIRRIYFELPTRYVNVFYLTKTKK